MPHAPFWLLLGLVALLAILFFALRTLALVRRRRREERAREIAEDVVDPDLPSAEGDGLEPR